MRSAPHDWILAGLFLLAWAGMVQAELSYGGIQAELSRQVLVTYVDASEWCGQDPWLYAIAPQPFGVQYLSCDHYAWFDTAEEAVTWLTERNMSEAAQVRVFRVVPVPIKVTMDRTEVPRPPKVDVRRVARGVYVRNGD